VYRSNDNVEIAAMLVSLAVEAAELDAVVAALSKQPGVSYRHVAHQRAGMTR
jgi:hypothetical protein